MSLESKPAGGAASPAAGLAQRRLWRQALTTAAQDYARDRLTGGEVAQRYRAAAAEHENLPDRYRAVLEKLLQPLEASALFSEESCAFSRNDLAQGLLQWVQATEALDRA